MKHIINLILCLCVLASNMPLMAKNKNIERIDSLEFVADMHRMIDSLGVVGISVAVVNDNKIVYNASFGYSDIESWTPMTNENIFRIASISKSFVATAIMQLVDDGKLSLNTPVNNILDFKVQNPKFPDTPITIEMLLAHTSSINDSEGYYISYDCINPEKNANWKNCYNNYQPGHGYEYCNLNFNLLGIVIEKISGERFDQYVENHIMKPLDINGSFNINSVDTTKCASLYAWDGKKFEHRPQAYAPLPNLKNYKSGETTVRFSPAGGVKINALGLAKYMLMHMNYGKSPLSKKRILSKKSAKSMQTPHTPEPQKYGLALDNSDKFVKGIWLTGHTGGAYGLTSAMFFEPNKKFGFVVICNGTKRSVLSPAQTLLYKHFVTNK